MPEAPCQEPASWVITTGSPGTHQLACQRHRDAILAKVTSAHRVLSLKQWLDSQPRGAGGSQAK
jgi:hypothetical protein